MPRTQIDYGDDESGSPLVPVFAFGPAGSSHVACFEEPAATAPGHPSATEFYVYRGDALVRICPSIGMAREVAAGL